MVAAFPYSASQVLTSFRNFFLIYPRGHDHVIGLLAAWALNTADWLIVQAVKAFLHTLIKWHSLSDRFLQLHKSRLLSACFWTCGTLSASVSRPFHFERCPSAFRVGHTERTCENVLLHFGQYATFFLAMNQCSLGARMRSRITTEENLQLPSRTVRFGIAGVPSFNG